jgi:hypothetical protein
MKPLESEEQEGFSILGPNQPDELVPLTDWEKCFTEGCAMDTIVVPASLTHLQNTDG